MNDSISNKDACQLCAFIQSTQSCCFLCVPLINLANYFISISGCVSFFMMMSVPNRKTESSVPKKKYIYIDILPLKWKHITKYLCCVGSQIRKCATTGKTPQNVTYHVTASPVKGRHLKKFGFQNMDTWFATWFSLLANESEFKFYHMDYERLEYYLNRR
jgi:hypothetical protein